MNIKPTVRNFRALELCRLLMRNGIGDELVERATAAAYDLENGATILRIAEIVEKECQDARAEIANGQVSRANAAARRAQRNENAVSETSHHHNHTNHVEATT